MLNIKENFDLTNLNTFKIKAKAKHFIEINFEKDMEELFSSKILDKNCFYILWWWANTVFMNDFEWTIIKMNIKWKKILQKENDHVLLEVWAWENRDEFIYFCVENNFAWLENLANIPWEVWASPVQNVWAYWVEAKDCIFSVSWYNLKSKKYQTLNNTECKFWYRDSIFKNELKNQFIITKVVFKLKNAKKNYNPNLDYRDIQNHIIENKIQTITPKKLYKIITTIRNNKLPNWEKIGTAGSFFKNPKIKSDQFHKLQKEFPELKWFELENKEIKLSSGQLIDLCWLKWYNIWWIQVYPKHALVLINTWNWTWEELQKLKNYIQQKVKSKFWINIEPEVILI